MPLPKRAEALRIWTRVMTPNRKCVSHVIVGLDGTLVNTDHVMVGVLRSHLATYDKQWDWGTGAKIVGTTTVEAASILINDYQLPCSTQHLISELAPKISKQWCNLKALPGATRLIKHLSDHHVPLALASNSLNRDIEVKLSYHQGWKGHFAIIMGSDKVHAGKPSPEIFLEIAKRWNVEPSSCLVIEDSLPGAMAGKAAGMSVLAVPSLREQSALFTCVDEVINSLLDLQFQNWGLPPFQDWIEGTLPVDAWYIGGPVIKGFGRGSKLLGIPTANLSVRGASDILAEHSTGVYFGWGGLDRHGIYSMVETWLLHDFDHDFYGEELRLAIVGYIRPEANFPSLEALVSRINEDRRVAEKALGLPIYAPYKDALYLRELI